MGLCPSRKLCLLAGWPVACATPASQDAPKPRRSIEQSPITLPSRSLRVRAVHANSFKFVVQILAELSVLDLFLPGLRAYRKASFLLQGLCQVLHMLGKNIPLGVQL